MELSQLEKQVYTIIHNQAMIVGSAKKIKNERLFISVLCMCDIWELSNVFFDVVVPFEANIAIRSLIAKGMIKEFNINGYPSYVPLEYWTIKIPRIEEIEMDSTMNYTT